MDALSSSDFGSGTGGSGVAVETGDSGDDSEEFSRENVVRSVIGFSADTPDVDSNDSTGFVSSA